MKKFIVIQMKVDEITPTQTQSLVSMSNIVRQVDAKDKEQAIGKFVVATQHIKAFKKLDIECYDISELSRA